MIFVIFSALPEKMISMAQWWPMHGPTVNTQKSQNIVNKMSLELERYTKDFSRLGGDMKLTREIYELHYRKKWLEQRQREKKKRFDDSIDESINAKDISPMSKRAAQINEMMKAGMKQREIAKALNVSPRNISDMKSRHNLPR